LKKEFMPSKNINDLYQTASKKSKLIIGLMSGTSLDGLDIALCQISGSGTTTKLKLLRFTTVGYSPGFKERVRKVFAKQQINFLSLTELNAWIGTQHGKMILKTLRQWNIKPSRIDAIASHGQTVFHSPKASTPGATINSTFQTGDGDHVAVTADILTISDFRQKHIAAGGEGAPLAVYGDYLLFSKKGEDRIMLNIGGIGNFTYLPASGDPKKVFVTDMGPGNTLLDQTVQYFFPGQYYDRGAAISKKGVVNLALLKQLKSNSFFKQSFPKTTGPELFNFDYVTKAIKKSGIETIQAEDLLCTLTRFSAETMAEAIFKAIAKTKDVQLYVSGGGAHNPLLLGWLKELLPSCQFHSLSELGLPGDAKEAVLFAVLANEALSGGQLDFGNRPTLPSVSMGKISFPR
jgi:anhydro-N-acetylmuramic acid kinase